MIMPRPHDLKVVGNGLSINAVTRTSAWIWRGLIWLTFHSRSVEFGENVSL